MPKRQPKASLAPSAFADAWIQVDDNQDPDFFVNVLDGTRADLLRRAREAPAEFFKTLAPAAGLKVLDVGCGTGDMLRVLAPLVAPGRVIGIDLSETMVAKARSRSEGGPSNVSFERGDIFSLQFEDGTFDRVIASQVLIHLPDPWPALAEMCRVLASDGMLAITEMDWGTMVVESNDPELSRRFTQLTCDGLRNASIARELPGRLRELGFGHVSIHAEVRVAQALDSFYQWFVVPSVSQFKRAGQMSEADSDAFLADLSERSSQGRYFSSLTSYTIIGSR